MIEKFKFIAKDKISHLPKSPGVFAFRKGTKLLYIGKAANLRERVKNHFQQTAFRDNLFINQVNKIGYIKTDSEFADPADHLTSRPASQGSTIEALILVKYPLHALFSNLPSEKAVYLSICRGWALHGLLPQ